MRMRTWRRQWMMAIAVAVSTTVTSAAVAQQRQSFAATYPAPLQDPASVDQDGVSGGLEPTEVAPAAAPEIDGTITAAQMSSAAGAACSCCNSTCCTKAKRDAATAKMSNAYKGVFYANDFSYLDDPCYDGPYFLGDALKGMCDGRTDVGGEIRVRYHSEENIRGLGLTGLDDEFWLTRYRMYANHRVNEIFRIYGEYLYADSGGETFNNRPIEENRGEIQNLFLDTQLTDNLSLRLGRQELLFGNQRLVSPLDWANTRRTFDGGRFTYTGDVWTLDGFFTHPVNRTSANESKIDDTDENIDFYGLYATRSDLAIGTVDAYYLGLDDSVTDFSYHTLGNRLAGSTDGGLLYELEGGVQFGENSPGYGNHDAGFFTAGLGRQLSLCTHCGPWNPTVWLWYDWASGGDEIPAARGDDGFDHLFPLAHKYLGFMDLYGRRNINDVNAQFITPVLGKKVTALLWYHYLFLDEQTTPYNVTMTPFNPANRAGDRELGHEIDVLFSIALNPRNSALLGYSYFSAGDYYDTTAGVPSNDDAQFFYFQYQTQF